MTTIVLCRHAAPGGDAARLAARIEDYEPELVYSSPLERALRTADEVARRCRVGVTIDRRLREIDFGDVEGLGFDELPPELRRGLLEQPTRVRFPGGETYAELRSRVMDALAEIGRRHARVAVVSHAGAIRSALATWLAMDEAAVWRLDQRYAAVNVVELIDGTPLVRLVNG